MDIIPKLPKISEFSKKLPNMPKLAQYKLATSRLQGFHGVTQGFMGKFSQIIKSNQNGGNF